MKVAELITILQGFDPSQGVIIDLNLDPSLQIMRWIKVTDKLENEIIGQMVLGYSKEWLCEDFNPTGVRECFTCGSEYGWTSFKWDNYQDVWLPDYDTKPTHIFKFPATVNLD